MGLITGVADGCVVISVWREREVNQSYHRFTPANETNNNLPQVKVPYSV